MLCNASALDNAHVACASIVFFCLDDPKAAGTVDYEVTVKTGKKRGAGTGKDVLMCVVLTEVIVISMVM